MNKLKPLTLAITVSGYALFTAACSSHQPTAQPDKQVEVYSAKEAHYPMVLQQPDPQPLADPILPAEPEPDKIEDAEIAQVETIIEPEADEKLEIEIDVESKQANTEDQKEIDRPTQLSLEFGFDQQELSNDQLAILEQHGEFLAQNPHISITINGHADSQGDPAYNEQLAEKRAAYAASILQLKGVLAEQIQLKSWGATIPAATDAPHPKNRRIELEYGAEYWVSNEE